MGRKEEEWNQLPGPLTPMYRSHHDPTEGDACGLAATQGASSFSLGSSGALVVKGEITSLLPVLGKALHSQKCLLVTPLLKDILASLDGKLKML